MRTKINVDRNEFIELWIVMTNTQLANHFKCSRATIEKVVKRYMGQKNQKIEIEKDELIELYYYQKMSIAEIARKYNCSEIPIARNLRIAGIKRRTVTEANRLTRWEGYKEIYGNFWNKLLKQAAKRKIPVEITIEDAWEQYIKQDRKCALTKLPLKMSQVCGSTNQTASLDRIDSLKGYTKDNIQWVHKHINNMKWDFDQQYFVEMCKLVAINN